MPKQQPAAARDLRAQIRSAIDATGETFTLLDAVQQRPRLPSWLTQLASGLDNAWANLDDIGQQYRVSLDNIEDALHVLVPRGWAVFRMNTEPLTQAVDLVQKGRGDEADDLLASQWEGDGAWRTKTVCDRVRVFGVAEPEYNAMFVRRSELLWKAKQHHELGHYEASVPLLHAQMEGITTDVTANRKFFSRGGTAANVTDPTQLVAIEASLAALQHLYTERVDHTGTSGGMSRHGVAHGRELGYDTRVNSAKCWSVLDALVEWARPLAHQEADRRRAERQAEMADSVDLDTDGRRLDDREFAETKGMLRLLQTSAMSWWRQHGRFRDDLIGGAYSTEEFVKRGLPVDHGTQMQVSDDGQQTWLWRATTSGWVLGIGMATNDRGFLEWLYSAESPPPAGPVHAPDAWGQVFATPPEWRR